MRKGILSLSMPGMRKRGKPKSADSGKAAEPNAATHEEPKVEIKAEKPLVQTIKVPKPGQAMSTAGHRNFLGSSRKPNRKK